MNFPDLEHPTLGILRYNNRDDWYEGQVTCGQLQIPISLMTDDESKIESSLDRADNFILQLENHVNNAKDYAVERLLELKNETWLDNNEDPLTPEQFKNRMVLEYIVIYSEGNVDLYHNDGDLFFGHCILITMDSNNSFIDADLAG